MIGPARGAARREPAVAETDRFAAGESDDGRAADAHVAACGDEAVARDQCERLVHGETFDDAVQVEVPPGEARIDEAVRRFRSGDRDREHAREERREGGRLRHCPIGTGQLAVVAKAAERPLPQVEELADGIGLRGGSAADDDVDAHRGKSFRRHASGPAVSA